jgi:membrane-bound ClpP family serine protease
MRRINQLLDKFSEYFAGRKGLLPLLGIFLVIINLVLRIFWGAGWLVETDLFLHLGLVLALVGILLAWAL